MSDRGSEMAKRAYEIFVGMKTDPRGVPAWEELPREQRGLLEWTARYVWLDSVDRRETSG